MFSRLEFFITETFISMRRHPAMAFAASVCIAASLFVAGIVGLIVLNVNYATQTTLSRVRFNVYFQPEVERQEAWGAFKRLRDLPQVADAQFVPREKAPMWLKMQQNHPDTHSLLNRNPLPDSVIVKAVSLEDIKPLKMELMQWESVRSVRDTPDLVQKLINITAAVKRSGIIIGFILIALSLVIIHHTIELTLYARRREMFIMSLVGATPATIALPFLLEGILYGLLGGGVALGVLLPLYRFAAEKMSVHYGFSLLTKGPEISQGILVVLVTGVALGLIGSTISVLKFLRTPKSRLTNA
jgi:cell division transport system permease protein